MAIVLASTSPRRSELLTQVGISFSIKRIDIDETPHSKDGVAEAAKDYVIRMAYEKCQQAMISCTQDDIIITADTIGRVLDNTGKEVILVKPKDFADASRMWKLMSDNSHQVMTAVCVAKNGEIKQTLVTTDVAFIALTPAMMITYWQTGEPQDKAGSYAIQGVGAKWVKSISGSYPNVVGLPIVETLALIDELS